MSQCAPYTAEIAEIVRAAFLEAYGSGDGEVALIGALRADGEVVVELAALRDAKVSGYILFSRATAEPSACRIAALAPVAVRIDMQGQGIGDSLIRAGLAACEDQGIGAVILLGEPAYYRRFGFGPAHLGSPYAGPHFQALELRPGALAGVEAVHYPRAFQSLG